MTTTLIVLRLVHIISGIFWAGATFFLALYLEPAIRASGPAGGRVMQALAATGYPIVVMIVAILAVLAGVAMYSMSLAAGGAHWASTGMGITLSVGALAGVLAAVTGIGILGPTGIRIGKLGQEIAAGGGPPSAEQAARMEGLGQRLRIGLRWTASLLFVAVVAMAVARYV
jgi:hypothetical protein